MQNKEQSALLVHRENYIVPKGEEHAVHYKIAKLTESGEFIEQPRIVKSRVKLFESVTKRGLELNGYTVEILYHPNNTYSNVRIEDKNVLIKKQDEEIAELKAKIEALKKKAEKEEKSGKGNKSDKDEKLKEE